MVEGAVHHGTSMALEGDYVDSHGQSEIGFAITRLLGFGLLPRIKQINKIKLYQPDRGDPDAYPGLGPAMTRPIRWELIEQNYDQMIKYATAIRVGTASTEAILRRFTRNASHPVYQAMLELGRAQKTIFIARYLRDRDLQREINEDLHLIEAWNRVNTVIFYGKSGEFATNRRDQQELGMLALHILQAALVYVNTLMIQDILAEPEWAGVLTAEDLRGLAPLFWAHVLPYGEVKLNMTQPPCPQRHPAARPRRRGPVSPRARVRPIERYMAVGATFLNGTPGSCAPRAAQARPQGPPGVDRFAAARPAPIRGDREGLRHAAGLPRVREREGHQDSAQLPGLAQQDVRRSDRAPARGARRAPGPVLTYMVLCTSVSVAACSHRNGYGGASAIPPPGGNCHSTDALQRSSMRLSRAVG